MTMNKTKGSHLIDSAATKLQTLLNENKQLVSVFPSEKDPYYCHFCDVETFSKQAHQDHIKSEEHDEKQRERENALSCAVESIFRAARTPLLQSSSPVPVCSSCLLPGDNARPKRHKMTPRHMAMINFLRVKCKPCDIKLPNRIEYEKHLLQHQHIRNVVFRRNGKNLLSEADQALLEGKPSNDPKGMRYITDSKGYYCKVCDEYFTSKKDTIINTHCRSDAHLNKLQDFIRIRKEEMLEEEDGEKDYDDVDMETEKPYNNKSTSNDSNESVGRRKSTRRSR